jgi:hypothetical protein
MIKTYKETIDGKLYTTKTLPATEGLVLLPVIVNMLGEKVANLILATDDKQQGQLLADPKIVAAVLMAVAERASKEGGLLSLKDLLRYTECDTIQVGDATVSGSVFDRFDTHFGGEYKHLFSVVWFVIRKNFIDL